MPETEKEKEREEIEKLKTEKERKRPWWQELSPTVLIIAVLVGLFLLRGIVENQENKNNFMFWLVVIAVILYVLSKAPPIKEEALVSPKEAELLVIRECERKKRWEQFTSMSTLRVGPVSTLQRRDGGGQYYDVAVTEINPYDRPKHYNAVVMAKGPERGFTTIQESIGKSTGREKAPERTLTPQWLRDVKREPVLEKFLFK